MVISIAEARSIGPVGADTHFAIEPNASAHVDRNFYRVRDYQPDVSDYGFAFIRWMLNTIAILMVSAAIVFGLVVFSTIMRLGQVAGF